MCKSLSNVFIPMSHSERLAYCEETILDDFEHVPLGRVIGGLLGNLEGKSETGESELKNGVEGK